MAKPLEKVQARKLRVQGKSIRDIAHSLGVSRASASLWCRDIVLSRIQMDTLQKNMLDGNYRGRLKGAEVQRQKRLQKLEKYEIEGRKALRSISERDLLMLGLGLHLGEGTKGGDRVGFTNSNPAIIKLFLIWIRKVFTISNERISCRVMINAIHSKRIKNVEKEWSKILQIPLAQFKKPVLIKVKNKKIYENAGTYLGTLSITITKSSELQYRILGLMQGLIYKL